MKKQYESPKLIHLDVTPAELLATEVDNSINDANVNEFEYGNNAWTWLTG